nr:hypothetical protein [Microctonus hyperodae filamentous virus]
MSQVVVKHVFAGEEVEVVMLVDDHGEKWFLANPFARILGYSKPNKAICEHVSTENVCSYKNFKAYKCSTLDSTLKNHSFHPQSKFIKSLALSGRYMYHQSQAIMIFIPTPIFSI